MLKYLFDIRVIVGALLGIYGLLLTVAGIFPSILGARADTANSNTVQLYAGTAANWWVGLVLLAVSAVFIGWAVTRPPEVTEVKDTEE